MTKSDFLIKLAAEGKLELVESSEIICTSYLEKTDNCLKSAKLLLQNALYENSVAMSYYAMYNAVTALLFKVGIKCENHAGAILLLKQLFQNHELFSIISKAKEERIDKQYYVAVKQTSALTESTTRELFINAEGFLVKAKMLIQDLSNAEIQNLRDKFGHLITSVQ